MDELLAGGPGVGDTQPATRLMQRALWGQASADANDEDDDDTESASDNPFAAARRDLGKMKFMQEARARERDRYAAQLRSLQEDIQRVREDGHVRHSEDDEREDEDEENERHSTEPSASRVSAGRRVFDAKASLSSSATAEARQTVRLRPQGGMLAAAVVASSTEAAGADSEPSNQGDVPSSATIQPHVFAGAQPLRPLTALLARPTISNQPYQQLSKKAQRLDPYRPAQRSPKRLLRVPLRRKCLRLVRGSIWSPVPLPAMTWMPTLRRPSRRRWRRL